ncbi:hypothetical protein FRB94_004661 [Tulasnella sp. JGI-2019a]|nr:hypothetical protein FRB94_004661 [Tulasnella sp. JGI-2019a]
MASDTAPPAEVPQQPEEGAIPWSLMSNSSAAMLLSFAVALLGISLFFVFSGRSFRRKRGSTILLVGPSDAGKSAIFSALAYDYVLPSHTSLQANGAQILLPFEDPSSPNATALRVVDVPGHPRLRAKFSEYMDDTRAIVFVVDAGTVARNGAAVAEHLHMILRAIASLPPSRATHAPVLLIHAHKADLLSSTPAAAPTTQVLKLAEDRTKTILERELEKRRKTFVKGVSVEGLGGGDDASEDAGGVTGLECSTEDGTFRFEKWDGAGGSGEVEFSSGWVKCVREDGITSTESEKPWGVDGLKGLKDRLGRLASGVSFVRDSAFISM